MSETTPIFGANSPLQDFEGLRRYLEGKKRLDPDEYRFLREATRKQWEEITNLYRLFREADAATGGGGGTSQIAASPKTQGRIQIDFWDQKLGFDRDYNTWHPVTSVQYRVWDDSQQRLKVAVDKSIQIDKIQGVIWIQNTNDPKEQHYIEMYVDEGSETVSDNILLGFDIGFDRATAGQNAGKFFMDVYEFPEELSNTPTTLIRDEIPTPYTRKLRTTTPILSASMLTSYDMEHGGDGIWCAGNLTLFYR